MSAPTDGQSNGGVKDAEKSNHMGEMGGNGLEPATSPINVEGNKFHNESWATRNGLNMRSFGKRDYGAGIVELDRSMKGRHLQMIAIGGSIGAGFFVGSGGALRTGGPASLLIDFLIIGVMMFNTVYALGEVGLPRPPPR